MSELLSISKRPITADQNSSLSHIISELLKNNISRIILTDEGGTPTGIISEKDVGLFLLTDDTERNLDDIPASQIMNMLTSVNKSMTVEKCAEVMLEKRIGSVGLNSETGLVGIITKTDIAQYYAQKFPTKHTVGDFMTISFIAMDSDSPLRDVVSKMIDEKISRIFLKNSQNEPQGIITFRDLFHVALEQGNSDSVLDNSDSSISVVFNRKGFLSNSGFGNTIKAKDVMTSTFESINFDEDLTTACEEMVQNRINGVGVRINGKLGGVVSKTDILKAIYADNRSK